MNDTSEREWLVTFVQTVGLQAMELPPESRLEFIKRTVATIHRDYAQKHGADASTADMAQRLERLTVTLLKMIEESGGSVGHA